MDKIVYVVKAAPGGCDGLAPHKDYPGGPVAYFFEKKDAQKKIGRDSRYSIDPVVIDLEAEYNALYKKLSPRERFILDNFKK